MKIHFILIFLLILTVQVVAQDETLLGGNIESGGYGGPVIKFGKMSGVDAVFFGGQGGWIINHSLVIGGGGYGLTNDIKADISDPDNELFLNFGYGGFLLEYIINSRKMFHFTCNTLIGAGGVSYKEKNYRDPGSSDDSDSFFVIEPGANIMLNFHENIRVGIGVSYRYVRGVDYAKLKDSDLSGVTGVITFKFGAF